MRFKFQYKNHRGEVEDRDVDIVQLQFTFTNHPTFGYQPGWAISGYDHSRGRAGKEFRTFYLNNMILTEQLGNYPFILFSLPIESAK